MTDFKPSQVALVEPVPFVGTFDHTESEMAAAFMVLAMKYRDDTWEPIFPPDCGNVLKEYHGKKGYSWLANPFCRPDFPELIEKGYAEYVGERIDGKGRALRFTERGTKAMQKWVAKED